MDNEILEALEGMVQQHCSGSEALGTAGSLDSFALSANADAMRLLAKLGRLVITEQYGRRVIGAWVKEEEANG